MISDTEKLRSAFNNRHESLDMFLRQMKKFDKDFCDLMASGVDFTIRLEIHGNNGEMIHCRVQNDGFERPKNSSFSNDGKKLRKSHY